MSLLDGAQDVDLKTAVNGSGEPLLDPALKLRRSRSFQPFAFVVGQTLIVIFNIEMMSISRGIYIDAA